MVISSDGLGVQVGRHIFLDCVRLLLRLVVIFGRLFVRMWVCVRVVFCGGGIGFVGSWRRGVGLL